MLDHSPWLFRKKQPISSRSDKLKFVTLQFLGSEATRLRPQGIFIKNYLIQPPRRLQPLPARRSLTEVRLRAKAYPAIDSDECEDERAVENTCM